jgi:RNA recognition motif-containing protein
MVRTKVFVGNLSFKTRENELAQEFSGAAKVVSANIITRGPRSLGYGFVELESEEDAQSAVKLMNKKEIDGRQINVEVAKPREEGENKNNNAPQQQQQPQEGAEGAAPTRGRGRGRGGFSRGGRGGVRGARGGAIGAAPGAPTGTGTGTGILRGRGGVRRRYNRVDNGEEQPEQQVQDNQQQGGELEARRGGRRRRVGGVNKQGQQPDTRTESTTTLFVANLPFSLDDVAFGTIFADEGLKFKTAHVVQKRNGRSKGFGFVEFDTEEDQKKALAVINGKKVEERELIVKVALTENKTDDNNNTGAPTQDQQEKK